MALQKILTKTYIDTVFEEVEGGRGLERFLQESFPYEEDKLLITPQVEEPIGLLERMVPTTEGDYLSAIALYDAYKGLKPLQAINAQFWESLSLTDLFPYMQKRWNLAEAKDIRKSILNHFTFKAHGMMRHGLAGLWWLVYMSIDEHRDNKYELTEYLFKNYTLRYIRFGVGKVIQHKEAAIGILQYIKDNEKNIPSLENVANGLTSYFNKLGAVKQLSFLSRDFFYDEMHKHIEEFKQATTHHGKENEEFNDYIEDSNGANVDDNKEIDKIRNSTIANNYAITFNKQNDEVTDDYDAPNSEKVQYDSSSNIEPITNTNKYRKTYKDVAYDNKDIRQMEIILKTMLRLSYPSTARVIARSISRSAWGGFVKEETVYNILKRLPEVEKLPNGLYALNTAEYKNM